jgi:hypothetical protein
VRQKAIAARIIGMMAIPCPDLPSDQICLCKSYFSNPQKRDIEENATFRNVITPGKGATAIVEEQVGSRSRTCSKKGGVVSQRCSTALPVQPRTPGCESRLHMEAAPVSRGCWRWLRTMRNWPLGAGDARPSHSNHEPAESGTGDSSGGAFWEAWVGQRLGISRRCQYALSVRRSFGPGSSKSGRIGLWCPNDPGNDSVASPGGAA